MKIFALILFLLFSFTAFALPKVAVDTAAKKEAPVTTNTLSTESAPAMPMCPECKKCKSCDRGHTEKYRDDSFGQVMLGYQFATTWVIGRKTASYTQILSRDWSIELEYGTSRRDVKIFGSDLGEMTEDRWTLMGKYYVGNSFHTSFGPYMYDLSMKVNEKFQDTLGNRFTDTWKLQGYGLSFAFGNRWQSKNGITWGVDWIRMNVPLMDGLIQRRKDLESEDKINVDRDFKILRRAPTFTFVGINVGYTF